MKLEMTELGPMKRALKIEVPADEVNLRFVRAYSELNRQVHIPGFRAGKAPLQLLEKRYAKTVEEDVIRGLVPDLLRSSHSPSRHRPRARRNSAARASQG